MTETLGVPTDWATAPTHLHHRLFFTIGRAVPQGEDVPEHLMKAMVDAIIRELDEARSGRVTIASALADMWLEAGRA